MATKFNWLELALNLKIFDPLIQGDVPDFDRTFTTNYKHTRFRQQRISVSTSGVTLNNNPFSSGTGRLQIVFNRDATNYITMAFYTAAATSTEQTTRIYPGSFSIVPDIDSGNGNITLTANTAACVADIYTAQKITSDP